MIEWPEVPLGDVATVYDGPHATPEKTEDGPWYLSISSLRHGRFDLAESAHLAESDLATWTRRVGPTPGDTLFSYETRIGEAAHWNFDFPAALGRRMGLLRPNLDQVDARFLTYAYLGPQFQEVIRRQTVHGATVERLLIADMPNWPLALPPLDEQRRIAGVLGALDDLIETNRKLGHGALVLACAVYERAVEGSGTDVPLRECGRWLSGGTPSTSNPAYWGGDIPWISASSLRSFFLTASDRQVTPEGAANGTRLVPAGSILFVVRGMSLKSEFRVGVAQREVAFGQDCKAIIVDEQLPRTTIAVGLLAASDSVLNMVDEASHGTGRLQSDRIEALSIRLPPVRQLAEVENALAALLAVGAAAEEETAELTRVRDGLLPLLMSGRVQVREVA